MGVLKAITFCCCDVYDSLYLLKPLCGVIRGFSNLIFSCLVSNLYQLIVAVTYFFKFSCIDSRFGAWVFDSTAMMRFKKGSTVEVLSKREVPSGSWFRAEIISGNGHYYNVKYEHCSPDGDQATEKVQRKAIRPCAPPIVGSRSWIHGDIVEVFEKSSWKPAKVIKVLDGGNYSVISLIGSSEELMLHKSNIRLQQSWKRNRWVLFNKVSSLHPCVILIRLTRLSSSCCNILPLFDCLRLIPYYLGSVHGNGLACSKKRVCLQYLMDLLSGCRSLKF